MGEDAQMVRFMLIVAILVCLACLQVTAVEADSTRQDQAGKRSGKIVEIVTDETDESPQFIKPGVLGFFTAVGIPYDLFFTRGSYFLNRDSLWYRASTYRGPWVNIKHEHLPALIRRHDYRDIIRIRDEEYEHYRQAEGYFRGRSFKPEKTGRDKRKRDGSGQGIRTYGED